MQVIDFIPASAFRQKLLCSPLVLPLNNEWQLDTLPPSIFQRNRISCVFQMFKFSCIFIALDAIGSGVRFFFQHQYLNPLFWEKPYAFEFTITQCRFHSSK